MFTEQMPLRTVGTFSAEDPSMNRLPTEWSIEEFVMMPVGSARAIDSRRFGHVIGIRPNNDRRERLLPASLVELWRQGRVQPEKLPWLLHAMDPKINATDFPLQENPLKSIAIVLPAVFVITAAVTAFVPMDGARLPLGFAVAAGLGMTLITSAILWIVSRSQLYRRNQQMDWALKLIESGSVSVAAPEKLEGTLRMYLKMGIKFYVILLAAASLAGGGAVLWSSRVASTQRVASTHQVVSTTESPARGRDTQVALTLSTGEAAHGKTVTIAIPECDEKVTVKIPAGLRDRSRLRLRGKGAQGVAGGPNGDLYITVHIA